MSAGAGRTIFRFGAFELDTAAYELRRKGRRIRLARQPMDLLLLLLERAGELVSREDIAKRLWSADVFVDLDAGIRTAILRIRQALDESPGAPRFVETVPGKGYRFVAPLEPSATGGDAVSVAFAPSLLRLSPTRRHNLPGELTSFVGRQADLAKLPRLLAGSRLLSLTGAGGVGKTRLAVRLASDLVEQFPGGVWLADLAPLASPDLIAQTIAVSLGVRESPQRPVRDALLDYLRDRHVLLLLDTCEHLVDACAELADALLRGARMRIVATSREALAVPGEVVYRVPPLALPDTTAPTVAALEATEATRLFIERATATEPRFTPTVANAPTIARICQRLDGIPLAIELAAARVAVLSLEQIEARLHDRFRLLTGGTRTAVARQRTLEATVEWSCQLLSDIERLLLSRISVFPASWSLEAAEFVCGLPPIDGRDMLDLLSKLIDKSLVVPERDAAGGHRYRLLETVRHFARGRLAQIGEADQLRRRHCDFFYDRFRDSLRILRGHDQGARLGELRLEQENVRAALEWALATPELAAHGVELAGALFWFWTKRGLFEEGKAWLERAVVLEAEPGLKARAQVGLAHMHYFQGNTAAGAASSAAALALGRETGEAWVISVALFLEGLAAFEIGDRERARTFALDAREAADASGDEVEHGGPLLILANLALMSGDQDGAQRLYDESIDVHRRAGDAWGLSILLSISSGLCIIRDDFPRARAQASEAMALSQELEDPRGLGWSLDVFAGLLAAGGRTSDAARLWGASDELLQSVGGSLVPTIGWIRERYFEPARTLLGDPLFAAARAEGRTMTPLEAVALAREQALLLT